MKLRASAILGVLTAALPPAVVAALQSPGMGGTWNRATEDLTAFVGFLGLTGVVYLQSLGATAAIMLPALLLILRFGLSDRWATPFAALAAGFAFPLSVGFQRPDLFETPAWLLAAVFFQRLLPTIYDRRKLSEI